MFDLLRAQSPSRDLYDTCNSMQGIINLNNPSLYFKRIRIETRELRHKVHGSIHQTLINSYSNAFFNV